MNRFKVIISILFSVFTFAACATPQPVVEGMLTRQATFEANGVTLSGVFDVPSSGRADALVIFVHGYGETNVVEQNWYYDFRARLAAQGISSFVWDKPGCGTSEGEFDPNQPVESSAKEVVAAAAYLREQGISGSQKIGLWGVSRAGWIAPLAMSEDTDLAFWISVSGVDDKESFGYLLKSNWALEGYDAETADQLYSQWQWGNRIVVESGTYADYLIATEDLRADPFFAFMSGGNTEIDDAAFSALVEQARSLNQPIDPETSLTIYVENFPSILAGLDVPVLALFGEKDSIVDWRATRALYERTIGKNPDADLDIVVFPTGNHNLHQSDTGSFKEMLDILNAPEMVPGYYEAISDWLADKVVD